MSDMKIDFRNVDLTILVDYGMENWLAR